MATNCVFPPELDDLQLLKYLDDPNADLETARHIEKCSYCRERAKALAHFQKNLISRLYRSTCPSSFELGEYHLRKLPANQRLVIAQHIRECPHCARELSELEGFLSELAPPPGLLEPIQVLFARLMPGDVALRGEATATQVFQVDEIVISLAPQRTPKGEVFIQGLLAAENQDQWTGATVELQQDYLTPLLSSVDDLGGFSFTETPPGPTQVTITSVAGIVIRTEKINLTL